MSAVGVADFLQTDDFFQIAKPRALPDLPDFTHLPQWPCEHGTFADWCRTGDRAGVAAAPGSARATDDGPLVPLQGTEGLPARPANTPPDPAAPARGAERDGGD